MESLEQRYPDLNPKHDLNQLPRDISRAEEVRHLFECEVLWGE